MQLCRTNTYPKEITGYRYQLLSLLSILIKPLIQQTEICDTIVFQTKIIKVISYIYNESESCVKFKQELSEFFSIKTSVIPDDTSTISIYFYFKLYLAPF